MEGPIGGARPFPVAPRRRSPLVFTDTGSRGKPNAPEWQEQEAELDESIGIGG